MQLNFQQLQTENRCTTIKGAVDENKQQQTKHNYQSSFNRLLPLKFGKLLTVSKLCWNDFKGKIDQKMPWGAHIYWNIQYKLINNPQPKLTVQIKVSPRSWVKQQSKTRALLKHEHGHLVIGYICALQFIRRVQNTKMSVFNQFVYDTFMRTLKQYQQMQKKYDEQTNHMKNVVDQKQWNSFLHQKLVFYKKIFDEKQERFCNKIKKN